MRLLQARIVVLVLLAVCFLAYSGGRGGAGGVSVNLSPSSTTVGRNGQVNFVATVSNATNQNVTWAISAGSINPTGVGTATFTAPNAAASVSVTATSVEDPSKSDSSTVTVVVGVATVTGRILRSGSSLGLANIVVEFRDNTGATVATATSNSSGNFSAAVPTAAVRFHLRNSTMPAGYYKQFNYDSMRYATTIATCSAPLPALTEGQSSALNTNITVAPTSQPPPPPPNGCVP